MKQSQKVWCSFDCKIHTRQSLQSLSTFDVCLSDIKTANRAWNIFMFDLLSLFFCDRTRAQIYESRVVGIRSKAIMSRRLCISSVQSAIFLQPTISLSCSKQYDCQSDGQTYPQNPRAPHNRINSGDRTRIKSSLGMWSFLHITMILWDIASLELRDPSTHFYLVRPVSSVVKINLFTSGSPQQILTTRNFGMTIVKYLILWKPTCFFKDWFKQYFSVLVVWYLVCGWCGNATHHDTDGFDFQIFPGGVVSWMHIAVNLESFPYAFTFTFSHLADAFVQSDVQGREQSS